jgi:hypothetical protein
MGKTRLMEPSVLYGQPAPMDFQTWYVQHGDSLIGVLALFLFGGIVAVVLSKKPG